MICGGLHGYAFLKFSPAFSKRRRRSNARSVGRASQGAKFSCGISFLPSFFLWASCVKEKSGERFKITSCRERGPPHLCGSPCHPLRDGIPPLWRFLTIRNFALCGGRPTLRALDWRKPLKRLDRNFNAASRCRREVPPDKSQFGVVYVIFFLIFASAAFSRRETCA